MDGTKMLFKKIRGRDKASFEALNDAYGWKLYSHIRKHTEDRAEADRIFNDSFGNFYQALESYEGDDPIEALLFSCADRAGRRQPVREEKEKEIGPWTMGSESGFSLPKVDPGIYDGKKEPFWLSVFYGICIVLLIAGILAAVWVMLFMLMSMNLIPQTDLGYSWFNLHIADLF